MAEERGGLGQRGRAAVAVLEDEADTREGRISVTSPIARALLGKEPDDTVRLVVPRGTRELLLVEAVVLWWLVFTGHITIGWLLVLAAANGAISAIEIPARQAMMIELVGREDLRDAIALNSSGFNLARIFGPGVAAAVIAKFGLAWCFGLNALSYFTVLLGLARIRLPEWHPPLTTGSPLHGMLEGLRYIRANKKVSTLSASLEERGDSTDV